MAVKAAFQIGLHSALSYKDHGVDESELRKRLWFGVVVQDRHASRSPIICSRLTSFSDCSVQRWVDHVSFLLNMFELKFPWIPEEVIIP